MKNDTIIGWEVVCPDGLVRYYPFTNRGDADAEAIAASDPLPRKRSSCTCVTPGCACPPTAASTRAGCSGWPEPSDLELRHPPCPGGQHTFRPVPFDPPRPPERGLA